MLREVIYMLYSIAKYATNRMPVNIRELQAFVMLADNLSFAKTAEIIFVTPSTLSRMIQRLEQEAEQELFVRDNRNVMLTQAGRHFLSFAQQVLQQWKNLKRELDKTPQIGGKLSIFCTLTAAHLFLNEILEGFRREFPSVELILETGDVAQAFHKVKTDAVDVAFAVKPEKLSTQYDFQRVGDISLQLIAPNIQTHFTENLMSERVDWAALPFIMPESGPAKERVLEWCERMKFKPNVYAKVAGHEAIVSLVALGCGIALAPTPVILNSPVVDRVQVLTSDFAPKPFELGIICKRKRATEPVIAAFKGSFKHQFRRRQLIQS